jgi:hypothetical protein
MKKIFFFLSIIVVISVIAGCSSAISQQIRVPEEVIEGTNQYIIQKTGDEFFNSFIKVDSERSSGDSDYFYVVYKLQDPDKKYIDEEIRIIVDSIGHIVNEPVPGIPDCINDKASCSFNIDEAEAKKIAADNGLSKGKKGWKSEFTWQPEYSRYVWKISSVEYESEGSHGYRGNGEVIIIDSSSGQVLDKSEWFVR